MSRKSLRDRFEPKVQKTEYCWIWTGATNRAGYAVMRYSPEFGNKQASHIAVEIYRPDDIRPSEKHGIMHSCDNPICVNPEHLSWGTDAENHADKVMKGRQNKGERHPLAKLSMEDVVEIKRLHSEGMTQRKLSEIYDISNQQISRIINNKRWR